MRPLCVPSGLCGDPPAVRTIAASASVRSFVPDRDHPVLDGDGSNGQHRFRPDAIESHVAGLGRGEDPIRGVQRLVRDIHIGTAEVNGGAESHA